VGPRSGLDAVEKRKLVWYIKVNLKRTGWPFYDLKMSG
jgi:hypothetical protein